MKDVLLTVIRRAANLKGFKVQFTDVSERGVIRKRWAAFDAATRRGHAAADTLEEIARFIERAQPLCTTERRRLDESLVVLRAELARRFPKEVARTPPMPS
jgi:hypothetical protein